MEPRPLASLLTSSGLTPAELCRRLAAGRRAIILTPPAVQGWFTGRSVPRDHIRPDVAEALGVDLDRFLRACAGIEDDAAVTP